MYTLLRTLILALSFTAAMTAQAAALRYTIIGTGSGTLAASTFTDAAFTFTLIGDPADMDAAALPLASAAVDIDGLGSASFLNPTRLGIFSNIVFFSRNEPSDQRDMFDFFVFGPLDLTQPFGPIPGLGVFGLNQFVNVASSQGALTFLSSSDVQFQAAVVPLPAPLLLLGTALATLAWRRRH